MSKQTKKAANKASPTKATEKIDAPKAEAAKKASPTKATEKIDAPKADTVTKDKPKKLDPPKGQAVLADGTIQLKTGMHGDPHQGHKSKPLAKTVYEVHGARIELHGKVFVATNDVDWIPVKKCGACLGERKHPVLIVRTSNGATVTFARCANEKCMHGNGTYVWVHPSSRLKF
jgi:hypothetical protein